jgi:alkyl sulfatase BDS1-like metallo-beta-lactamase superfamily hydrolase
MAVRLDAKKATGKKVTLEFALSDGKSTKDYAVTLENGVLNYRQVQDPARCEANAR